MTLVPTEPMFGRGQTESFALADPAPLILESVRPSRHRPMADAGYEPHVRTATAVRSERLRELGFADLAQAEGAAIPFEFARALYPELTGESYQLWSKFLPTRYPRERFVYDSVPDEALGHIESAVALACFDRIEIWTPERNDFAGRKERTLTAVRQARAHRRNEWTSAIGTAADRIVLALSIDPMAVGVLRGSDGRERFFAIVRWGESLMPVEKVRAYVAKVDRREAAWNLMSGLPYLGYLLVLVLAVAAMFSGSQPLVLAGMMTALVWAALVAFPLGWFRDRFVPGTRRSRAV